MCEVVHETKLTSEISCPTDSCLAQLVEHQSDYQEGVGCVLYLDTIMSSMGIWILYLVLSWS